MLSVYVRSPPSVLAHSACAKRTTTTMGSRLSILATKRGVQRHFAQTWLGKPEGLWRADSPRKRASWSSAGSDLIWCADGFSAWSGAWSLDQSPRNPVRYLKSPFWIPFVRARDNRVKTPVLYRVTTRVLNGTLGERSGVWAIVDCNQSVISGPERLAERKSEIISENGEGGTKGGRRNPWHQVNTPVAMKIVHRASTSQP